MDEEKINRLKQNLRGLGAEPSGPIYISFNKHLAKILHSTNELEAIYHLSESHSATLRSRMGFYLSQRSREPNVDSTMVDGMKERIQFDGSFQNGFHGLQQRLAELPKEWVVVQVTLEWDPLSRFPCRNINVNRGLGIHLTRLPCGNHTGKTNRHGKGEPPITTYIPTFDDGEDRLTFMAAIRDHLKKFDEDRTNRQRAHNECSLKIEATVNEMQMWLGGWLCLFMGRLVSEKLEQAVKAAVDSFISTYNWGDGQMNGEDVTEKALNVLYLLASSSSISSSEVQKVVSSLFKDKKFASHVCKKVNDVKLKFSAALHLVERHPVILLVDEELDILPFEVIPPLQDQSFTRMPSIHFLHTLYFYHKNSVIKKGVNTENCYYVINPSQNLPNLQKLFESFSNIPAVRNWKGVLNTAPTSEQFLSGLQDYDLFLYCGHGGGNQFLSKSVESAPNKAAVFLFGCSSSSLDHLGGRVEMTSLSYSYLMTGSPCVVGMLWQVLDGDMNAMTHEVFKTWCNADRMGQKDADCIDDLDKDLNNMNLNSTQSGKPSRDLGKAVNNARKVAVRFLNKAAIVIRGLPLSTM